MSGKITRNVNRILEMVADAATQAGREPSEVSVLAATKYTDRQGVMEVINAGITIIGENRVQDARGKLGNRGEADDIRREIPGSEFHMIGHLQSNKANHALKIFDHIDTIDRITIAEALEKRLASDNRILPCTIEIGLTGEESKTGVSRKDLPALFDYVIGDCPHLDLRGFTGMGPLDPDPEAGRPTYRELRKIYEGYMEQVPDRDKFAILSMGMSADYHVAIQEGATLVRIGRALFV
ncbi:MAG TPA: YggS family pyridoxal phosphate-dependent enzyme [bacterium]|jgi:hypothetical protein